MPSDRPSTRTIPSIANLSANPLATGEVLPTTARSLNFRLVVRDNRSAAGGYGVDDMLVTVASNGPFRVTGPNPPVTWWGTRTVTWDVAGTDPSPVSTANVNILLSTDGGMTFPTTLPSNTPNDGSADISLPAIIASMSRIKVEAVGNIYFDISNVNFSIIDSSDCGTADFDGDGDSGTDADIDAFFACLSGSCCPTCWYLGADLNGDGDAGADADTEAFFRVLAGGTC